MLTDQHFTNVITRLGDGRLENLIFDVDGTLYNQTAVRLGMLGRILRSHLTQPCQGVKVFRALRAYRNAHEFLRSSSLPDAAAGQVELASSWTGIRQEFVEACVSRWMEEEPLELVARSLLDGVTGFLQEAVDQGLRLAVFSDYAAAAKLEAMRLSHFFDVVVTAQDPDVGNFKPHTRGLEVTLRRLGCKEDRALYIGDRPEVDAVMALRAGMACVIIGPKRWRNTNPFWRQVSSYPELRQLIFAS